MDTGTAGIAILIAGLALAISYGLANRYELRGTDAVVILDQFTGQVETCIRPSLNGGEQCLTLREGSWLW